MRKQNTVQEGIKKQNLLSKGMKKIKSPMRVVKCPPTTLIGNFAI
jgi:hypothetical protein